MCRTQGVELDRSGAIGPPRNLPESGIANRPQSGQALAKQHVRPTMAPKPPFSKDPFQVTPDTLGLSAEEMRRLGHKVVDMVVDRLERRDTEPVVKTGNAA